MTRSELIKRLKSKHPDIFLRDAEQVVSIIFDEISDALVRGDRIELRGFGSFSTRERAARKARNPKTGESVELDARRAVYFRAGKQLKEDLN